MNAQKLKKVNDMQKKPIEVADYVATPNDRLDGLKKQLAARGQDPKYLEQMLGRLEVEKVKSLSDAEIERAFANSVLSSFCVQYLKVARDCGLALHDVQVPMSNPYKDEEVVLFKDPSSEVYVAESMSGGNIVITDGWLTDYVNIRGKGDWVRESDQLPITQEIGDFLSSFESAEEAIAKGNSRPRQDDDSPSPM